MAIIRKIVHLASLICYVFIGIYLVVSIPSLFGYKPLVVLTGSMEPTLKVGSIIYYKSVSKEDIKQGDIITFDLNGNYVTHRVNRIENNYYYTKGDYNNTEDPFKVTYLDIKGKVLGITIPFMGYYIRFISENMYLLVFVILLLVLEFFLTNSKSNEGKRY